MSTTAISFDDIAERVCAVMAVPRDRLLPGTLLSDLGTDSLMLVEMAIDLQEEFDIVVTQEEFSGVTTFGDLVALVQARPPGTPPARA
jgi:acyl carrier protein